LRLSPRLGEQLNSSSAYVIHDGTAWGTPGQLVGGAVLVQMAKKIQNRHASKIESINCARCIQQRFGATGYARRSAFSACSRSAIALPISS